MPANVSVRIVSSKYAGYVSHLAHTFALSGAGATCCTSTQRADVPVIAAAILFFSFSAGNDNVWNAAIVGWRLSSFEAWLRNVIP